MSELNESDSHMSNLTNLRGGRVGGHGLKGVVDDHEPGRSRHFDSHSHSLVGGKASVRAWSSIKYLDEFDSHMPQTDQPQDEVGRGGGGRDDHDVKVTASNMSA